MASVLLVEDDPLVSETIRSQLEFAGHDVTLARHGGEGLKALETGTAFDLVISDLLMPEVEGIEFIMTIRRQRNAVPIIAITGGVPRAGATKDVDYLELSSKLGATAIIRKPFTRKQLLAVVDECLATQTGEPQP
ncbi:Transcriptional activator protein CzcR [Alphaproteobacteria bacterium SO-S41]|nr:Transcriptional activator protein CzcR [Alphaproteobacteria bacterium SO-S41]